MTQEELNRNFDDALKIRLEAEYLRGFNHGLSVAKTIRGWLTAQPDTLRLKQLREWADNAIESAEKRVISPPGIEAQSSRE
jgi:hypothetical protein